MKTYQGYIFSEENNDFVSLYDILQSIPDNNWVWKILVFEGVGYAPNNMTIPEFEELINSSDEGYNMTWKELNTFAKAMGDIYDFVLIATETSSDIVYKNIEDKNISKYSDCKILIEIFDSTTWELRISDDIELLQDIEPSPPSQIEKQFLKRGGASS